MNGLVTYVQQIAHKNNISTHCFIYREKLAVKDINENLFEICIKAVHFVWTSTVNIRIFKTMCEEIRSGFKYFDPAKDIGKNNILVINPILS